MTLHLGIIGVGHLAGYLVEGLCRSGDTLDILLSPRNAQRAAELIARFDARIAADNHEVVAKSDIIILATRPNQALGAAEGLPWRPGQTLICVAAGIAREPLSTVAFPATVVRAMPVSCAAIGESPTSLFPDDARARSLLARLGPVIVLPDETSFQGASVIGGFYAWMYALVAEMTGWLEANGAPTEIARLLVTQAMRGATGMILAQPDKPLADMLSELATPGGITERGLEVLGEHAALKAWRDACQAALERIQER